MRACLYVALFTALVAVMESRAEAQTEPEIQKMLDAWKQRRKASGNIRYELKGEQMHPRHSGMSDLGGEAQNFDIRLKREYTIDWSTETGAYRLEGTVEDWDSDKKVAKQKQGISVFDGKTHRALLPKQ